MNPEDDKQLEMEQFIPLLTQMLRAKQPLSAAPTFTPRNSFEQWQLYESGSTRRIYFYVAGTWRYAALT